MPPSSYPSASSYIHPQTMHCHFLIGRQRNFQPQTDRMLCRSGENINRDSPGPVHDRLRARIVHKKARHTPYNMLLFTPPALQWTRVCTRQNLPREASSCPALRTFRSQGRAVVVESPATAERNCLRAFPLPRKREWCGRQPGYCTKRRDTLLIICCYSRRQHCNGEGFARAKICPGKLQAAQLCAPSDPRVVQ